MKRLFCLALLLNFLQAEAQNLVVNPSFEDHIECPLTFDDMPSVSQPAVTLTGWTRPTKGTSDYYNSCTLSPYFGVPYNAFAWQPARTGNAYAGAICAVGAVGVGSPYREYLQNHLSSALIAGHHYNVSYWLNLADYRIPGLFSVAGVDQMGAYLAVLPEERVNFTGVMSDLVPQVESPKGVPLADTANWMNVSGSFQAVGGEEWLIIGNFRPLDSLTIKHLSTITYNVEIYQFFDDVCVIDMEGAPVASAVQDVGFCGNTTLHGPAGATGFLWDDGSTGKDRIITQPGTYWVKSVKECTLYADTFKATVRATLPPQLGNDTVMCPGDSIIIDASNPDYQQYRWNTGAVTPAITVDTPGTYTVTIISECLTASDSITIKPVPAPEAFLPEDKILCDGTPLWLYLGQRNVKFAWNTGDTSCCIELKKEGSYIATVTNTCGASATDTINITYSGCRNCVLIPTAFSPNGDGLNDLYQVMTNCTMKSYLLEIYNRWGQAVFRSRVPNEGWDGKVSGISVEKGVYFYRLHAVPAVDLLPVIDRKGDITVVK